MNGKKLRVGSLFSGIEGFGLGFTLAGWSLKWGSEIDKHACRVLEHRFPGVPNQGDITKADPASLDDVDCITFGFPCQDLSVAGHRAGLEGARSGLFWEAIRILIAKRPKWILAENVPGLQSSNSGMDFGVVLWALAAIGYGVAYAELDAQHFGVPQRRRRIIIVGCLGDAESARKVLADAPGGYRNPEASEGAENHTPEGLALCVTGHQHKAGDPSTDNYVVARTLGAHHQRYAPDDPIVFDTKQDPISGPRAGALSGLGRQGVLDSRVHPTGPAHLRRGAGSGAAADNGGGHGEPGKPETSPSLDATRNGTTSGIPRWVDLPMWRRATEPWGVPLDGEAIGNDRGEEGGKNDAEAERRAMVRGSSAVAGCVDTGNRERESRKNGGSRQNHHDGNWDSRAGSSCNCADTPRYRETGNAVPVPVAWWLAKRIKKIEEEMTLLQ